MSAVPPDPKRTWIDEHLALLRGRRDAVWIVVRNLIPVAGVVAFGWSAQLALLNYWYDGVSALLAILAAITPAAVRSAPETASAGPFRRAATSVFVWGILAAVLGLPYWLALAFTGLIGNQALWRQVAGDPWLWATAAAIFALNLQHAIARRYTDREERDLRQTLRWDVYLLILRALAMIWFTLPVPALTVVALALLMIYLELFPARALGAIWGDPDKLWMDDEDRRREAWNPSATDRDDAAERARRRRDRRKH